MSRVMGRQLAAWIVVGGLAWGASSHALAQTSPGYSQQRGAAAQRGDYGTQRTDYGRQQDRTDRWEYDTQRERGGRGEFGAQQSATQWRDNGTQQRGTPRDDFRTQQQRQVQRGDYYDTQRGDYPARQVDFMDRAGRRTGGTTAAQWWRESVYYDESRWDEDDRDQWFGGRDYEFASSEYYGDRLRQQRIGFREARYGDADKEDQEDQLDRHEPQEDRQEHEEDREEDNDRDDDNDQ